MKTISTVRRTKSATPAADRIVAVCRISLTYISPRSRSARLPEEVLPTSRPLSECWWRSLGLLVSLLCYSVSAGSNR